MPHQSSPDAISETALLSEYWDAVLDYANLCTTSPQDGMRLATEAFRRGIRETRTSWTRAWGPRLPWLPLLLSSVRKTAADWQAQQAGDRLDPGLRIWLTSDRARRYATPRREQPLALRGLWDLPEADADLLWSVEVESQSLTTVAQRLGWDSAYADEEIARVRARFRELCQRNHVDALANEECRSYAGLLDAATRSPDAAAPDDLWQHLARCTHCKEAAACLYLHGSGLPGALAGGVLGWGGLPYLERRRRVAAENTGGKRLQTLARSVGPPLWDRVKGMRGGRGKSRTGRPAGAASAARTAGAARAAETPRTNDTFDTFDLFGAAAGPGDPAHATQAGCADDAFEMFDPFGTTGATDPFAPASTTGTTGTAPATGAFGATGVIRTHGAPGRRLGGGGGRRRRPRKGARTRAAGILAAAAAVSVIAVIAYTNTDAEQDDGLPPDGSTGPGAMPTVGPTLPSKGAPSQSQVPPTSGTSTVGHRTGPSHPPSEAPSPSDGSSPDKPSEKQPSHHPEPAGVTCTARYTLDNEWPDGFQAKVTLTPRKTVRDWRLSWEFENGQRITQMWNGEFVQHGRKVTVTPADYNETARGGEALEVGFLGSWDAGNAAPTDLALNGRPCDTR
ncbi:cellulose-binding domain-containing protein [Streptomyces sp. ME19-01-6]|uniref:cellulose-binding domain-containing protein n=1 Tax=Streptomyces sp. ME19-01-6 TaxID=3028686 RepID=UPI0029BD8554|nr:cellulose-binding domain-containing protein [Streptomyces sp. ME19-01-6]MDX3226831.1 cellulose-binding domain-containing protein [Streptomyces sp. ME19-01-6]